MSTVFKVVGEEGNEDTASKRVKLSPDNEERTPNEEEEYEYGTVRCTFPKEAAIEQKIRCLLLDYILSPDFLAYPPPRNFEYYPHKLKQFSNTYDMSRYDLSQFLPPISMGNYPTGEINCHYFNLTCDVRRLKHPEITHIQCCLLTHGTLDAQTWSYTQVVKFHCYPINRYGNHVKKVEMCPNNFNATLPPKHIQLDLEIEERGLWVNENGECPKIQNTSDWRSLVDFVQDCVQNAFKTNGRHVFQEELPSGKWGFREGALMVI